MRPLIDADILLYEIGFAAETAWRAINEGDNSEELSPPPWGLVQTLLEDRVDGICARIEEDTGYTVLDPNFYLSSKALFRSYIATVKSYKGTRVSKKPWHYNNIKVHLEGVLGAGTWLGLEADDIIAIHQSTIGEVESTIIVSRDKDLRQVPGWSYSWELGKQPAFGPVLISKEGSIRLSKNRTKIEGTGLAFFYSQCLTGDTVDNIPGLPLCGPVKAFSLLGHLGTKEQLEALCSAYKDSYGVEEWEERLLEQGRLLWMTRRLNEEGGPVLWEIGMTE